VSDSPVSNMDRNADSPKNNLDQMADSPMKFEDHNTDSPSSTVDRKADSPRDRSANSPESSDHKTDSPSINIKREIRRRYFLINLIYPPTFFLALLITPKNITGKYFGAIMAIFNFSFHFIFCM